MKKIFLMFSFTFLSQINAMQIKYSSHPEKWMKLYEKYKDFISGQQFSKLCDDYQNLEEIENKLKNYKSELVRCAKLRAKDRSKIEYQQFCADLDEYMNS